MLKFNISHNDTLIFKRKKERVNVTILNFYYIDIKREKEKKSTL